MRITGGTIDPLILVVGDSSPGTPGATVLLEQALASAGAQGGAGVVKMTSTEVSAWAKAHFSGSRPRIFTQQEGRLSSDYSDWAAACMAAGASIIELNVFDLPSLFRPRSLQYRMATYTREGAWRYRLRSATHGGRSQDAFLPLPNVLPFTPADREQSESAAELRLLRMGRPDVVKWSDWEVRFAASLATVLEPRQIHLTLVGSPTELVLPRQLPANLTVSRIDYSRDIAAVYEQHDVYLHYSRIGETYGNTFAEAQAAGLFIIGAFDPRWDCAPLDYLEPANCLIGTPRWLLRHPEAVAKAIDAQVVRAPAAMGSPIGALDYLDRLTADLDRDSAPIPGVMESARLLASFTRRLNGVPTGVLAPLWELLRGVRMRRQPPVGGE